MSAIIVFCTASTLKEARALSQKLVGEKLAACVSIVPRMESRYWWKGKMEQAGESLLVIKTSTARWLRLAKRIRELHSYTVPEIVALPVVKGNPDYLKWLHGSIRQK